MNIGLDTLSTRQASVDQYGEKVAKLLNLGENPAEMPFALFEKKMLGGKGEVFTSHSYTSFKSNGGFTKLKKKVEVPYSDITSLEFNNASFWMEWKLSGDNGGFKLGLIYYGKVRGASPNDLFWYEKDEFPRRSEAFYSLLSAVLPKTGLTIELKPEKVRRRLDDALECFLGNRTLEEIGLQPVLGNSLRPRYAAVQNAFGWFLAGTAVATEDSRDGWLELFGRLDSIFARMIETLREEIITVNGGVLSGESRINEAGDKFSRLSSIWYLRQIANLHFASRYLPEEEVRAWPMKILIPRSRTGMRNNRTTVYINLPDEETFEEALSALS